MLGKYQDMYESKFGEIFPTEMYGSASYKELLEMIKSCIEENKTSQELYPVDISDNYIY